MWLSKYGIKTTDNEASKIVGSILLTTIGVVTLVAGLAGTTIPAIIVGCILTPLGIVSICIFSKPSNINNTNENESLV